MYTEVWVTINKTPTSTIIGKELLVRSRMRGQAQRTAEPKTPRESLNSSSIQKYLKEASSKSPGSDTKQAGTKDKKKDQQKQKGGQGERPRQDPETAGACASSDMEEQRSMELAPNKTEMMEMFARLENVIKTEILNVGTDMGYLLRRVEEAEETSGKQAKEILDLKAQVKRMLNENRMLA